MGRDFIKEFERNFRNSIELCNIEKKNKILVACSGGKDSTIVLHLLNKFGYKAEGLLIDLRIGNYSETNLKNIKDFCKKHKYRLHIVDIREIVGRRVCYIKSALGKEKYTNCHICGVIKRYILNKKAREMGFEKLATGHNLDDEAQTIIMNLLNGTISLGLNTGMVIDGELNGFIPRIKPFFYTPEKDIRRYSEAIGLKVLYDRCPCAVNGQRYFLRIIINELEDRYPGIKRNIVDSYHKTRKQLRKELRNERYSYCSICNEPSASEKCKMCEIIEMARQ